LKTFNEWAVSQPTDDMRLLFKKRTRRHIRLVGEFCDKIADKYPEFKELLERKKVHDASKFEEPEYTPYLFVTWKYKCKREGEEFKVPKDIEDRMHEATLHHVTTNNHHPEYHSPRKDGLINKENRDAPPEEIVDATEMPDLDVAEMCADWMAMSKELGGHPKDWADKNVNVRWKFTEGQKKLIYEIIEECWVEK
jgi:hypothetical protein